MEPIERETFGDLLRHYRRRAGLTQEELAEKAELSPRGLLYLERNERHPHAGTVRRLADALGLTDDERLDFLLASEDRERLSEMLVPEHGAVRPPNNLPDEPTSFIGRGREIDQVTTLLRDPQIRLVTLTGPGGTGKTRLALRIGDALLPAFPHGVFLVDLASLSDPALVAPSIAAALGIQEQAGVEPLAQLTGALSEKRLLLILDNYEHLLEAAPIVSALLDRCRQLRVLVTSRIPLHLTREHEYPVRPLAVPDPHQLPDHVRLSQYEAVALFIDRALAVLPDFTVTNDNAAAVAEMCVQLDGLPLAIELAAARIKLFPPHALLRRLHSRLQLLTGEARDRPTRQQTIRAAIDWSYSLLPLEEQTLFACLGVFAGGWTFEAAEVVCNPNGDLDLLEGLAALVDQSLVQQAGKEESRFSMLETIREYAAEKLAARDGEALNQRHAEYYLEMSEQAEQEIEGVRRTEWLQRMELELGNVRSALRWFLETGQTNDALRLASAVRWRERLNEGRGSLERALALPGGSAVVRARALHVLGGVVMGLGDMGRANVLFEQSLTLRQESADSVGIAGCLVSLSQIAHLRGDAARTRELLEEALHLFQGAGDAVGEYEVLVNLSSLAREHGAPHAARTYITKAMDQARAHDWLSRLGVCLSELAIIEQEDGHPTQARAHGEEALRLHRSLNDQDRAVDALNFLAWFADIQEEYERALPMAEEAVSWLRENQATARLGPPLHTLGIALWHVGETTRARSTLIEALQVSSSVGWTYGVIPCLEAIGGIDGEAGHGERAAHLFGAAESLREQTHIPLPDNEAALHQRLVADVADMVDADVWARAWDEGRAMGLDDAVAYALEEGG